jgi:hypothetical protein
MKALRIIRQESVDDKHFKLYIVTLGNRHCTIFEVLVYIHRLMLVLLKVIFGISLKIFIFYIYSLIITHNVSHNSVNI